MYSEAWRKKVGKIWGNFGALKKKTASEYVQKRFSVEVVGVTFSLSSFLCIPVHYYSFHCK